MGTVRLNSMTGLVIVACAGEVGSDVGGLRPMFLRISSFGEVAISLSREVIVLQLITGFFGTIRRIVPSTAFTSVFFPSFHFLGLEGCANPVGIGGGEVKAMLIVVATNAWVCGVGVSVPLRLNMETLRRLMPFGEGCSTVGDAVMSSSGAWKC